MEPLPIVSFFESPQIRRLSLSPQLPSTTIMSRTSSESVEASKPAEAHVSTSTSHPLSSSKIATASQTPSTIRAEVLRHVFQRPLRTSPPRDNASASRIGKSYHHSPRMPDGSRSKSRVAFHRYITGLFGNNHEHCADPTSSHSRSRTSSFGSKPNSLMQGSIPSIDLVSPAAFIFSGPNLGSTPSVSHSTSCLPSLIETEIDGDIRPLGRAGTDSFSMLDYASDVSEGILEPVVEKGIVRTMSDVLLGVSTPIEEQMPPTPHHSATLDYFHNPQHDQRKLVCALFPCATSARLDCSDSTLAALLLPRLDFAAQKALRLTNRAWYRTLHTLSPPTFPPSYRIPIEIVQQIYAYLGPKDFNAARHTCSAWMRASLHRTLLMAMLRRGGWSSSAETASDTTQGSPDARCSSRSDEWTLSRYLSRQCALSSRWTGNGLESRSAMAESSQIDFEKLSSGYSALQSNESGGLLFSTSVCGRFLLVARDALIYIYNLFNGSLYPATSIISPRRVLSMSMDVSCGRHAVAALLEGRMGIVCELRYGHERGDESPVEVVSIDVQSDHHAVGLQGMDDHRQHDRNLVSTAWHLNLNGPPHVRTSSVRSAVGTYFRSIPIENGTTTFYRHLCSEDDPPRSVSICPQRRCVAFGCSAGIELHWIDALTGHTLSR